MPSEFYLLQPDGTPKFFPGEGTGAQGDPLVPFHKPYSSQCKSYNVSGLAASADLVSAVAGKKIRVLALALSSDTATTVKLQSDGSNDVYPEIHLAGDRNHALACNTGLFETGINEKLNIVFSSGVGPVSVFVRYEEVN